MSIILFYISFILIVAMFTIKYFGISFDHHEAISNIVCENDKNCHKIVHHSKNIFSKIKFENFHRLTVNIADYIKKKIIYLKRRFDSKQPAFFLSPQKPSHVKKNSVSFFLKNVTDYKNSLKKKDL